MNEINRLVAEEIMRWDYWNFIDDYTGGFPMFVIDNIGLSVYEVESASIIFGQDVIVEVSGGCECQCQSCDSDTE